MSDYVKQNFTSGQILKAEHLNHMEDGIEQLSEGMAQNIIDIEGYGENKILITDANSEAKWEDRTLFGAFYDQIVFQNTSSRGLECSKTYEEIAEMFNKNIGMFALYVHTTSPSTETFWASYLVCIAARLIRNLTEPPFALSYAFTFFDYLDNKMVTLQVNSDNTIVQIDN